MIDISSIYFRLHIIIINIIVSLNVGHLGKKFFYIVINNSQNLFLEIESASLLYDFTSRALFARFLETPSVSAPSAWLGRPLSFV